MELLHTIEAGNGDERRLIELYVGDLTALAPEDAVDVLVVSAFPDDYLPNPGTLIGALAAKGISVAELAANKAVDLRDTCSCWMSHDIRALDPGIQFKRVLCFEPLTRGSPPEVVGDIFRSLIPFVGDSGVRTVAMPLVASGDARVPPSEMLPPLLEAAVHWMSVGVPLERLKIVIRPGRRLEIQTLFSRFEGSFTKPPMSAGGGFTHDVFVSYAHEDGEAIAFIVDELHRLEPGLRVFIDRRALSPGSAWQHDLFEALDLSRRVLVAFSPHYVGSRVCKEEFNIAWARSRETETHVMFPVYLYSAPLPTYMKLVQFVDCREGDRVSMSSACGMLVSEIRAASDAWPAPSHPGRS